MCVFSGEGYTLLCTFRALLKLGGVWEGLKSQGLQCPNSDKPVLGSPT